MSIKAEKRAAVRTLGLAVIVCGLVLLATLGVADANLTHNKRFVFRGTIHPEGDPVNILFHGGDDTEGGSCVGDGDRSPNCVLQHVKLDWDQRGNMREKGCNGTPGKAHLKMLREDNRTYADPGAIWHTSNGRRCKTQYHYRNWNDSPHGHDPDNHQWQVGAIHHERRNKDGKHVIDYHWETAEHVMVVEMGSGDEDTNHCTYPNYYRLPGSRGTFQGKKSNGKISRISFHQISEGGCAGS